MARGALVAAGAVLVVGGGAAIGYALTREAKSGDTPAWRSSMIAKAEPLTGAIAAVRGGLKERATTLASLQAVQAAVATDERTAEDMVERGELRFDPQRGEVIQIGVMRSSGDDPSAHPRALVVEPRGAPRIMGPDRLEGSELVLNTIVDVVSKGDHDPHGYVGLTRRFDVKPVVAELEQAGVAGELKVGDVMVGIGSTRAGLVMIDVPGQRDMTLLVEPPAPVKVLATPLVAAGGAGTLLGLMLVVVGMMGKRSAGGPLAPSIGTAVTKLSAQQSAVAAGTPSLVDSSGNVAGAFAPANLGAGAMIGRWEIIRRLGSGGMADVYLAHSRGEAGFEKQVAIKVMHPHLARNERAVAHFLDEARLAARIAHPNVVAIQDLGKIGNDYVIVMDYVDGVDLERLLASARTAQRQVPIDVGLGMLRRICDGLNAAHKATGSDGVPLGVIHRDVKSANVLVSRQGGVKVVDFGIAKAATQSHHTVAGETKGTPSMMAPEQRVGEQVDVRADVYSVAAVGYEILTGHGVNLDLAALAHLGVENWPHLPLPSSLRPQLPAELDGILLNAMAFERDRRPADCAVFEAVFETVMKQHGMNASDKDIARWVAVELAELQPPQPAAPPPTSKPARTPV